MNTNGTDFIPFEKWLASISASRSTGWRYRQAGLVVTVNRLGKLYVTREEAERFRQRLSAGEFARPSGRSTGLRRRRVGRLASLVRKICAAP